MLGNTCGHALCMNLVRHSDAFATHHPPAQSHLHSFIKEIHFANLCSIGYPPVKSLARCQVRENLYFAVVSQLCTVVAMMAFILKAGKDGKLHASHLVS